MQAWEELEMMREEGRREGKEEGRREGKEEGLREGVCAIVRMSSQVRINTAELRRYLEEDKNIPEDIKAWAKAVLDMEGEDHKNENNL